MNLIDGAPFGPETVKAIGEVFDQASARINRIFANDPNAAEAASVRLAEAILSVATEGNTFVEDLKNRVNRGAGQDNRPERDAGVTAAGKLLTAFEQSPWLLVGFTPRQRLDLRPIATRTGAVRCSAELLTIPSRPRCSATRSSARPSSKGSESEIAGQQKCSIRACR